jgi:hypothetical protein
MNSKQPVANQFISSLPFLLLILPDLTGHTCTGSHTDLHKPSATEDLHIFRIFKLFSLNYIFPLVSVITLEICFPTQNTSSTYEFLCLLHQQVVASGIVFFLYGWVVSADPGQKVVLGS